ncbi:hypothetical protein IAT38_001576 [Cryptococcus sp. DSM 104549]
MLPSTPTCQTCSSNLPPTALTAAFLPPCCGTPICAACVERNPRLREYVPCLRCGDPRVGILSGGGRGIGAGGERRGTAGRDEVVGGGGEVVFEIGDDDDEEVDAPPGYDVAVVTGAGAGLESATPAGANGESQPLGAGGDTIETATEEEELETVEVRHTIARGDTLLSIARKYAADPHDLLTLNSLPPTALSTHPRILQTRKSLIISRRRLPASSLPRPLPSAAASAPEEADRDPERERAKQLKRFQLLTKSTDSSVAKTYLSLEELREAGLSPSEEGTGEALDPVGGEGGGGKKAVPEEGNREERALDRFWRDEEWEEGAGGPERRRVGRWKVVGGGVGVKS